MLQGVQAEVSERLCLRVLIDRHHPALFVKLVEISHQSPPLSSTQTLVRPYRHRLRPQGLLERILIHIPQFGNGCRNQRPAIYFDFQIV